MTSVQLGLLNNSRENDELLRAADSQLSLPVAPTQLKIGTETPVLTEREFQIMHMTLSGYEIPAIAIKIFLSVAGVKWRLSHVYAKFGVKNRLQLIEKSATKGLQFKSESGITHTFHNNINLVGHTPEATP